MSATLLLRAALLALKHEDGDHPNLYLLEAGTRLRSNGGPLTADLVDVIDGNGHKYTVFYSDLMNRSERVTWVGE